jgi:hypothetical protein
MSGVIDALPSSLRERGTKLMHLLQTVMEWNEQGEIVNRYTGTPIPRSNVVNAVRHLLVEKDVGDPAERYVSELARDTHILPTAGEVDREMPPPPIVTKTSPKTIQTSPQTVKTLPIVTKTSPKTVKTSPKTVKTSPRTVKTPPKTVKAQEKKKKTQEPFQQTKVAWLTR